MKNRPIALSILSISICSISFGLLSPTTVILLEKNHSPTWIIGSVTTIAYACIFLLSSVTGKLISKYGLRNILNIGFLVCIFGTIGLLFWRNYPILFIGRSLQGIGATLIFVATEVLINYCSTDKNRGFNMNMYVISFQIGLGIGTFLIWTVQIDEKLPYMLGIIITTLAFFVELIFFKNIEINLPKAVSGIKFSIKTMPLIAITAAAIYGFFESSSTVVIPLFSLRSSFSNNEVYLSVSGFVLGGVIVLYIIGKLSDRISKRKLLLNISMILSILFTILLFIQIPVVAIITFFFIGGLIPAFYTVGLTYVAERIDMKFISEANGCFAMFFGLGTLLGPSLGSFLIDYNQRYAYWAFSLLLCVAFISVFGRRSWKEMEI